MYMEEISLSLKMPTIKLVDGSSGGGSVTTIRTTGYSYLPLVRTFHPVAKAINAGIPNIGLVLGPAIGLGAARKCLYCRTFQSNLTLVQRCDNVPLLCNCSLGRFSLQCWTQCRCRRYF